MDSNIEIGEVIIAKFNVKNKSMYIKLLWSENDKDLFHIKVFYEDDSWTGIYTNELAAQRLMKLDETKEEYNRNVRDCLSGHSKEYIIDFTKNPDDMNLSSFAWKKQYEGAIKLHGVVTVMRDVTPTSKDVLVDILLEKHTSLKSGIEVIKETNNNLTQNLEQYVERLKELTENKILLESTLYGRFVQVLNEKKRRIQLLQDTLKSFNITE